MKLFDREVYPTAGTPAHDGTNCLVLINSDRFITELGGWSRFAKCLEYTHELFGWTKDNCEITRDHWGL